MQWVFPMAGRGSRVASLGDFKPFIKICERMIIEWCLLGLIPQFTKEDSFYFIVTQAQGNEYRVEETLQDIFNRIFPYPPPALKVINVAEIPSGPACTVSHALDLIDSQNPVTICNPDQYIRYKRFDPIPKNDGAMVLYCSTSPKSSYAVITDGLIQHTAEKKVLSTNASAGVYIFGSGFLLQQSLNRAILQEDRINGEYYIAPVMNQILTAGGKVHPIPCYTKLDLGDLSAIADFESMFRDFQVPSNDKRVHYDSAD